MKAQSNARLAGGAKNGYDIESGTNETLFTKGQV